MHPLLIAIAIVSVAHLDEAQRMMAVALVLNAALIPWLGFILSSTLLFACVARGFSSDRPARDLGIGFLLAFVAWYGFAKLLSINLGAGLIEGLF